MITNATILTIQQLWNGYVNGTNCTGIIQQEKTTIQAAIEQIIVNLAQTNLSAAAQTIFNQMKTAYDAMETAQNSYSAAPANVQTELQNFDRNVMTTMLTGGGSGSGMAGNFQPNGGQGNFGNGQGFGGQGGFGNGQGFSGQGGFGNGQGFGGQGNSGNGQGFGGQGGFGSGQGGFGGPGRK